MKKAASILLSTFAHSSSSSLNLKELVKSTSLSQKQVYSCLLDLWKDGQVFSSIVQKGRDGYLPPQTASWSGKRLDEFYSFNDLAGAFQILSSIGEPAQLKLEATLYTGTPILSLSISNEKDQFIVGDQHGNIWIGSIAEARFLKRIDAHKGRVWSLDYSPDGSMFVSGSMDGTIVLWTRDGEQVRTIDQVGKTVYSVRFTPLDGQYVLAGLKTEKNDTDPAIMLWSISPPKKVAVFDLHENGDDVYCVCFTSNGDKFLSGGSDKKTVLYSLADQKTVFQSKKTNGTITCCDISPNDTNAATGIWTGAIKMWDLVTGKDTETVEAHNTRVLALSYSPSGNYLVSGSRDSQIAVWRMPSVQYLTGINAHPGWVRAVAFITEDSILSCGSDGTCKIWKLVASST